jgi:hypothetical protein
MEIEDRPSEAESRRLVQDETIAAALATGRTYEEAGVLAGVSERTVARRMADPTFARTVAERRGQQVQVISGQLSSIADKAVKAVSECLDDADPRTRLAAGRLVLDLVLKFRHQNDLELAVAEIREHLHMEA